MIVSSYNLILICRLQIPMTQKNFMKYLKTLSKPWKFLAPMVGNSEHAYRILARRYGADVCYTEMVNCKVYNKTKANPTNNNWFTTDNMDRPLVIQICGNDPIEMSQACLSLQEHCDAIDINFGCPQDIAKKGKYGAYLQDDWDLVREIVSVCSKTIRIPLFCKIRVFESVEKTVEYAKIFEEAGASLLAVHGRTKEQRGHNSGVASWDHIKAVKTALNIPVVANGSILRHCDVKRCFEYTGCDGIMAAEGHLFNPTIFLDQKFSSLEIAKEYLEIAKLGNLFEGGPAKSHLFKIFRTVLTKLPHLRVELDNSKTIEDYANFFIKLENLINEGVVNDEDFEMHPYIRKNS